MCVKSNYFIHCLVAENCNYLNRHSEQFQKEPSFRGSTGNETKFRFPQIHKIDETNSIIYNSNHSEFF